MKLYYWENSMLKNNGNNLENFLIEISSPLILYVRGEKDNFEAIFTKACWNNRLFASWHSAHPLIVENNITKKIFELTDNFLSELSSIGHYKDCHCESEAPDNYHEELENAVKAYIKYLLDMLHENNFFDFTDTSEDFLNDYTMQKNNLLKGSVDLESAEKSLLYWEGAVSEKIVLKALLVLKYSYIGISLKI